MGCLSRSSGRGRTDTRHSGAVWPDSRCSTAGLTRFRGRARAATDTVGFEVGQNFPAVLACCCGYAVDQDRWVTPHHVPVVIFLISDISQHNLPKVAQAIHLLGRPLQPRLRIDSSGCEVGPFLCDRKFKLELLVRPRFTPAEITTCCIILPSPGCSVGLSRDSSSGVRAYGDLAGRKGRFINRVKPRLLGMIEEFDRSTLLVCCRDLKAKQRNSRKFDP